MAIEDLLLAPYVAAEWRSEDFSVWTLPDPAALWVFDRFSSLHKGDRTLWHHTSGTGTFPAQTVDPDFVGTRDLDLVDSPTFDLSSFPSADDWHIVTRIWWRPEHVLPSLGGVDQPPPRLELYALANSVYHFVGVLDQPILDPTNDTTSRELSRVAPDAGNANVGALGQWWYEQQLAATSAVQAALLGQTVSLRLALACADRDATGYGVGVEKISIEILRGAVAEAEFEDFPVHLHRSYTNSRRWI